MLVGYLLNLNENLPRWVNKPSDDIGDSPNNVDSQDDDVDSGARVQPLRVRLRPLLRL